MNAEVVTYCVKIIALFSDVSLTGRTDLHLSFSKKYLDLFDPFCSLKICIVYE